MKKFSLAAGSLGILLAPVLAFAQGFSGGYVSDVFSFIENIISRLFPIATALVVLYFFYEVYQFMKAKPEEKEKARKGLISSVIAVSLVFLIFGVIKLLGTITGTGGTTYVNKSDVTQVKF